MHEHDVVHVVDPEVFIAVIAHAAQGIEGLLAGLRGAEFAADFPGVVAGHETVGGLSQVGSLGDLGAVNFLA